MTPPFDNEVDFDLNNKSSKQYLFADALLKMLTDDNLQVNSKETLIITLLGFPEEVQKIFIFDFMDDLIK